MKSPSTYTGVIAPGKFTILDQEGDEFYFTTQTCPDPTVIPVLRVSPSNTQNETNVMQGQGMYIQEAFKGLRLTNNGSSPLTFEVVVGFRAGGQFIDNTLNVIRAALTNVFQYIPPLTRMVSQATLLNAGDLIALPGTGIGGNFQRKAVLVSNSDATNSVTICDLPGTSVLCYVEPNTSIILEVSGAVSVKNPNLVAVNASVSELWFYT